MFPIDADGASNLDELNLLLQKRFMIRRTKNEIYEGLTNKIRKRILLNLHAIDKDERQLLQRYTRRFHHKNIHMDENFFHYYAFSAQLKLNAVCRFLERCMLHEIQNKFIIFGFHLVMLDGISNILNDLGVEYIRIDGGTKIESRNEYVNRFQNNEDCRVAIMSLQAGAFGLNLTAAKKVLFAEYPFNPALVEQAESRAHRMGQTDDVEINYLHARGTVDDILWRMIINKQKVLTDIGLDNEDLRGNFYAENHVRDKFLNKEIVQPKKVYKRIRTLSSSSEEGANTENKEENQNQ